MSVVPNADRSAATRAALLDATIEAIIRYGYHGATTTRIAELSGLTRGAQMYHFATKPALVVEALLHLHERRTAKVTQDLSDRTSMSLEEAIEILWSTFDDDTWIAGAELWTAARTDPELRAALVPAERTIGQRIRTQFASIPGLPPVLSVERTTALVGLIVATMRGIAMHEMLDPNPKRAKRQRAELIRALKALAVHDEASTHHQKD